MSIKELFLANYIDNFMAIPLSKCKITKDYLLKDFTKNASVIFITIPYNVGVESNLASFAAVPDYHIFANNLFAEISNYITNKFNVLSKGFADHSPFDEIYMAASCGLGIIGDNGLLITNDFGTYICIGELVCELSLEKLESEGIPTIENTLDIKNCEHCGACQKACPANAINNKNNCISSVSQKKQDLTKEEIELIKNSEYIWGCDVCQKVCPHSQNVKLTPIPYFHENVINKMTHDKLSIMSDEEYKKYTFSWRKKEIMERNLNINEGGKNG